MRVENGGQISILDRKIYRRKEVEGKKEGKK
jgi:hypothetical protein